MQTLESDLAPLLTDTCYYAVALIKADASPQYDLLYKYTTALEMTFGRNTYFRTQAFRA